MGPKTQKDMEIGKTYEDLKSKGVQFAGPPEERFSGIEANMKDGQGNWFSMTQHKDH